MSRYLYSHPEGLGLGAHHAAAHGRELPAEMRDLDMPDGTECEHADTDQDTGALILTWRDRTNVLRSTAVSAEFLASHFTPLEG